MDSKFKILKENFKLSYALKKKLNFNLILKIIYKKISKRKSETHEPRGIFFFLLSDILSFFVW